MSIFTKSDILLPKDGTDLQKWAALACDQFTSQPEYWQEAEQFVGDAPSMLKLMLPEIYLDKPDTEKRIEQIYAEMDKALKETLTKQIPGYIYVERTMESGAVRQGLVGCVDLEAYSYEKGAKCGIRPSENTVIERIPPRLAVRRKASIESPHILMLIDDEEETVIEPLAKKKDALAKVYDLELMLGGGRLRGWAVEDSADFEAIDRALANLLDQGVFCRKYGVSDGTTAFCMAVGDGNHSLASAKALWEEIKPTLSAEEQKDHPARFCLVELENVQSPAIEVESIHRVIFNESYEEIAKAAKAWMEKKGLDVAEGGAEGQTFVVVSAAGRKTITVKNPPHPLAAGTFEDFWADFSKDYPGAEVDYVHGEDAVEELVAKGAVGVMLPDFEKGDLFRGVALGGVLPKKTFSMGHAKEKRYYMECRKIRK
ncbi:DUF1015 domain-containing protein [Ruminococcaceae bacterium OttesenSCG-928-I18]|nr:DUF1015 domain-containing protein [Ruminococcaceae bacterium OttesenSCG-928-I18]